MSEPRPDDPYTVTPTQLEAFKRDGVVVLPNVFSAAEVEEARAGLAATLLRHGIVSGISTSLSLSHQQKLTKYTHQSIYAG